MAVMTTALPHEPTMLEVGQMNEENLGSSRSLLTRLEKIREHLVGARAAQPPVPAEPTPPGLVEAFREDCRQQAALTFACHDEARIIETALALKHPDEPEAEATPELRETLGGSIGVGQALGGGFKGPLVTPGRRY